MGWRGVRGEVFGIGAGLVCLICCNLGAVGWALRRELGFVIFMLWLFVQFRVYTTKEPFSIRGLKRLLRNIFL